MTDNEVLDLLRRRITPLSINQVIEILETKISWCDAAIKGMKDPRMTPRIEVEKTTLEEATAIVKRINQKPLFHSGRKKIVADFEKWAEENNAQNCMENFLAYLQIIGLIAHGGDK